MGGGVVRVVVRGGVGKVHLCRAGGGGTVSDN